nr:putative retrotransposon Ty1-copia subclass protein [Tanacetum cinerariifolium]
MAARGQNQGKMKNKLAYAPKPNISHPPKREDPAKDSICHECGETGHWKMNCPQYLSELLKKKKLSQGAKNLDGFINHFVNNIIQVSRNNMVYFSAIPRDGIFEIDVSNSYANDSSMYAVSNKRAKLDLDSALLWHCRLGHISKKRIEKLQHDGIINLTDLRAFEKCVSCISGKIERKPYTYTSLNHEEDDQEIDEPQSDINPVRRSTRTRRPINCMCLYIDVEEHELEDLDEPANYKVALLDPEKTVGSKWLLKKKTDMDGTVHAYKARLVAKGYTQTPRINYEETFSLVAYIRAIRILIAIAAFYDYKIWQIDVKTAFFNGYLSKQVLLIARVPSKAFFATSSAEAEYIAAFDASKEADNTGAITIANELGITKGARHFRAKVHHLREVIKYGDVKLEKVHTYDNLADPFTKTLAFPKHSEHTMNIGMLPANSLM